VIQSTTQNMKRLFMCHLTLQENTQLLLQYDGHVASLLDCNGYVPNSVIHVLQVFHCNTVLHPRHKLSYFKQAGWPTEWINTAEDIVCAEFKWSYALNNDAEVEGDDEDIVVMVRSSMVNFFTLGAVCLHHYRSLKISLTTSPHLLHLGDQSFMMNWMLPSVLTPKMLLM
jgi:hypothetical protein